MAAVKKCDAPAETVQFYEDLVARFPEVERKGASVPYTSVNGHMFTYLNSEGVLALRLPPGEREKFLEKYNTTLMVAYGITQKEYVTVPPTLLAQTDQLGPYFTAPPLRKLPKTQGHQEVETL